MIDTCNNYFFKRPENFIENIFILITNSYSINKTSAVLKIDNGMFYACIDVNFSAITIKNKEETVKKTPFLCAAILVMLLFLPLGASATTITFDSNQSFYPDIFPGVDMTIFAFGGGLTWDSSDNGLGIGDDEISGGGAGGLSNEHMVFEFSKPIYISSFSIVDLFPQENNPIGETGIYWIDSPGNMLSFGPGDNNGNLELEINALVSNFVAFYANSNPVNDYAVAGVTTPVPEPGTIVLMGLGLVGLAGVGRKKLFKK